MNEIREQIIFKVYITVTDVQRFLRCSWDQAHSHFDQCRQMCIDEGKQNLKNKIYYKHFLKLLGISESEIHRLAKIERQIKKDA